jgi:hypothetical protein
MTGDTRMTKGVQSAAAEDEAFLVELERLSDREIKEALRREGHDPEALIQRVRTTCQAYLHVREESLREYARERERLLGGVLLAPTSLQRRMTALVGSVALGLLGVIVSALYGAALEAPSPQTKMMVVFGLFASAAVVLGGLLAMASLVVKLYTLQRLEIVRREEDYTAARGDFHRLRDFLRDLVTSPAVSPQGREEIREVLAHAA